MFPGDSRRERELDSRAVISGLRCGGSGPRTAPINLNAPGHFGQQSGAHPVALGLFRAAAFVCESRGRRKLHQMNEDGHIILMQ